MKRFTVIVLLILLAAPVFGHGRAGNPPADGARRITFPDVEGYEILVLDPHTHSVFSDGHVWPRVRVEEALRDGLDALQNRWRATAERQIEEQRDRLGEGDTNPEQ